MNAPIKVYSILRILTLFILLGFSGCADTKWPTWLTGEPDESVLNAPRIVGAPSNLGEKTWPVLGGVPQMPDFSKPEASQEIIDELERDKAEAEVINERVMGGK